MLSFFGAKETSPGVYAWNGGERIPPNWTNRLTPYTNALVSLQIDQMYAANVSQLILDFTLYKKVDH